MLMKKYLFICCVFALFSCGQSNPNERNITDGDTITNDFDYMYSEYKACHVIQDTIQKILGKCDFADEFYVYKSKKYVLDDVYVISQEFKRNDTDFKFSANVNNFRGFDSSLDRLEDLPESLDWSFGDLTIKNEETGSSIKYKGSLERRYYKVHRPNAKQRVKKLEGYDALVGDYVCKQNGDEYIFYSNYTGVFYPFGDRNSDGSDFKWNRSGQDVTVVHTEYGKTRLKFNPKKKKLVEYSPSQGYLLFEEQ